MAGAQDALPVGQQPLVQAQGGGRVATLAGPASDVGAGRQGAGIVGAEDAFLVGQQPLAQAQGGVAIPVVIGWSASPSTLSSTACWPGPPARDRPRWGGTRD